MSLYQQSVLKKYLATQDKDQVKAGYSAYSAYFLNKEIQENIRNAKKEQFQQKFLMELFVNIFGYVMNPDAGFNLTTELKNIKDLEKKRSEKRQHLFEAQDTIDDRKENLLDEIERRLKQEEKTTELFTIKWKMI